MVACLWSASDNEVDWHAALHHKIGHALYRPLAAILLSILYQSISKAPYLKFFLLHTKLKHNPEITRKTNYSFQNSQ